ncbi:sporulation protein YunB [Oceanobacillus halotolerans]|uniref:sporulation protein YunB n=1 Tax=Oceanobacillus halotolerans TaxID=2663380 RepID=UPI0013DB9808|nr:sporulation protein YunB [Oceanobacillus halotolerans]
MLRHRNRFRNKRTPPPAKYLLLATFVLFVALVFFSIRIIDEGIEPPLMAIAEEKTVEFATRTINAAVKSTENMSFEDLIDLETDSNGHVSTLGWNSAAVNRALRTATHRAEYFLYGMNKGETIDTDDPDLDPIEYGDSADELADRDPTVIEIPIGQATNNAILANLGPKIPVHFEIVGSIQSDVVHEVSEFGVNAALMEIYIPVDVSVQIVIPFSTSTAEVSTKVFIDSRVIMGDVPEFFSHGGSDGPSIAVPRDSFGDEEEE